MPTAQLANNYPFTSNARRSIATASFCAWTSSNPPSRSGPAAIAGATRTSPSNGLTLDGTKILTNYEQYMGSNTRTLTPNLVNEARFGYTRFFNSIGTLSWRSTTSWEPSAFPGFNRGRPVTWGIPAISFNGDGYSGIGDSTEGPYANDNNTLQFVDNLSWIRGKHTFRFGLRVHAARTYNQVGNQFSRGQFTFQPNATQSPTQTGGDAFADFLLGDLYQSDRSRGHRQRKVPAQHYGGVRGRYLEASRPG